MSLPERAIAIDEEGYPLFGENRVTDSLVATEIFQNLKFAENGAFITSVQGQEVIVEAFDEPLVARHIAITNGKWKISIPFEIEFDFEIPTLTVDEWDRFHGLTKNAIPFVLGRTAQAEFFNLCEDYDDDSVTVNGKQHHMKAWMQADPAVRTEQYWSQIYQTETPRWELNQASPALEDMLPRLKLPKSRVLVLGCGSGNDAAFFAKDGHHVTAVDMSQEALDQGQEKHKTYDNIRWIKADAFQLPEDFDHSFDIIFEHTCLCAVDPQKRNELVSVWRKCLSPKGHLLAVLFCMEKRNGPPFGGTEWEYRERLKKHFHFIFWGRWHQSIDRRNGKELLVYAQMKN